MPEPTIHVIPGPYYGGASPKGAPRASARGAGIAPVKEKVPSKVSHKTLFIIVVGVMFLAVLGGSIWYFTRVPRPPATPIQVPPSTPPQQTPPPAPTPPLPEAETPTPEPEPQPAPAPAEPAPFEDVDNDGLTTAEEALYHTQATAPDSDNDGFIDGHEVTNLYNPAGIAPERLEDAGLAKRYANAKWKYELLTPVSWTVEPAQSGEETVFVVDENQAKVFSIQAISNSEKHSTLADVFAGAQETPGAVEPVVWTSNKAGVRGIVNSDRTDAYFMGRDDAIIYEIQYTDAARQTQFKTTFVMMLNSFVIH